MSNLISNMSSLGVSGTTKVSNALQPGQFGAGLDVSMLDAYTPQIFTPTTFVVIQTPKMYDENTQFAQLIKSLVESHTTSITGIDLGYTLEVLDSPLSHDGQNFQQPGKSKRNAISPSMVWHEKTGNIIWNVMKKWIWDMQHPDGNMSQSGVTNPLDMVPSTYSMTMMGLQYPANGDWTQLVDAALYCNMFPTETGDLGLEKTVSASKNMERTIPFTGFVVHNDFTREYGKYVAKQIGLADINYNTKSVSIPEVSGILADSGLKSEVSNILETQNS